MIHIYYTVIEAEQPNFEWIRLLDQMPQSIQERVARYRKLQNKYQLVYGRLLLKKLLLDIGAHEFDLDFVQYDAFQKPYWKKGVDFSIAHSGKVIGCALSTIGSIGLDIEQIQTIDVNNFQHILNKKDYQYLRSSEDLPTNFFTIWTIKEAVSKADGRGLSMDVQQLEIDSDKAIFEEQAWAYKKLDLHSEYLCHAAVSFKDDLLKDIVPRYISPVALKYYFLS